MVKKIPKKKKVEFTKDRKKKVDLELEGIPFIGGLLKGIEKLVDLAERVEEAGGEIKRKGEIKGLGRKAKGVYGFSIGTGIGGRPRVQTFGNIQPVKKKAGKKEIKVTETREPIVDVFDEKNHILIIAELPGVTEESIKLNLKGDILTLEAGDEKRRYSKEILLPRSTSPGRSPGGRAAKVDFEKRKENFKNGILEIKIPKSRREISTRSTK